jgi:hypothetical protein
MPIILPAYILAHRIFWGFVYATIGELTYRKECSNSRPDPLVRGQRAEADTARDRYLSKESRPRGPGFGITPGRG